MIVVSGLAASGKTTVGRALGDGLSLPLIDKDDILEALFDSMGCENREQRHRLSRASDEVLFRMAASCGPAVLVNWWNHNTAPDRLRLIADSVVEVFCDCPIEVAAARFETRQRHPGHLDRLRTPEERAEGIRQLRESYRGPLRLNDSLITVNTGRPVNVDMLLTDVRAALALAIQPTPMTEEPPLETTT